MVFGKVMMCGGHSDQEVNADHQELADKHRADAQALCSDHEFTEWVVTGAKSQVVNGTNYTLTMNAGDGKTKTIVVYKQFSGETSLSKCE